MGAGKTILMGSIVATEFAMAMEYPDGPFVQNAPRSISDSMALAHIGLGAPVKLRH